MPVLYEVYQANGDSKIGFLPLYKVYGREEDAVQAVYGLGFPGTYHIVKVTTNSELAGVYVVPETQEFLDQMEDLRKKVQGFRRTIDPDTDTVLPGE